MDDGDKKNPLAADILAAPGKLRPQGAQSSEAAL